MITEKWLLKQNIRIMASIDCKSVSIVVAHEFIQIVLNIIDLSSVIMKYLKYEMKSWYSNLRLLHEKFMNKTNNLNIKNEIFQAD